MSGKIRKVLMDVVGKEKYNQICDNYEEIKKQSIVSIGLDSIEYIAFLSELEKILEIEIDVFIKIDTLQDVEDIIDENK